MTYTDMTKTALNDLLPENLRCKNASQLKKTSKAELIDILERRDATQAEAKALSKHPAQDAMTAADLTDKEKHVVVALADACMDCNGAETVDDMLADNMTWSDVADIAQRTGMNQKTVKGVLGSLTKRGLVGCDEKPNGQPGTDSFLHDEGIRVAFELLAEGVEAMQSVDQKIRDAKIVKAPKTRELPDRVMVEPGKPEDVKATKAGSKRHLMAEALAKGATVEELVELLGWTKDTVSSAFRVDMGALGLGVERKGGKYYLLMPKGVKRIPAHDADTTRADALVAACK